MPKTSPVVIQRLGNKIEIEHRETGELLAWCWIGDDVSVETIADLLSAKRLGADAMKLRQMVQDARRITPIAPVALR
jgi:hypothetical protein